MQVELSSQWAIVEQMGYVSYGCQVSSCVLAGAPMLRVEIPAYNQSAAITTYIGGASLYRLTPCTEEQALRYNENHYYSRSPVIALVAGQEAPVKATYHEEDVPFEPHVTTFDEEDDPGGDDEDNPF